MIDYYFNKGNVVKWNNSLYIVINYDNSKNIVEIIPFRHSNVTCYISETFPKDETKRIDSIEFVTKTVQEFITKRILSIFEP